MDSRTGRDPGYREEVSLYGPIYDPETYVRGVPLEMLDALREQAAVHWVDEVPFGGWAGGEGFWLVLRHAEVQTVLSQPQYFSSWLGGTQMRDPARPEDLSYVRQMMLNKDPPEHRRLRRLLASAFSTRALQTLEARIDAHAEALVGALVEDPNRRECDFVSDVAAHLPVLVLADLLGMPPEDRWLTYDWSNRVIGFQDPDYATSDAFREGGGSSLAQAAVALRPAPDENGRMPDPRTRAGIPDLYRYAHLLAETKRSQPGDDIMSLLITPLEGVGLSVEEFENLFWLFSVAGNETLRNGLPGGLIALAHHPEAVQRLRRNPSQLSVAVDEMLRWWTPVMNFRRTVSEATELGGYALARGDKVIVSFTAANRDPRVFDHPQRFQIDRQPNPHLSFGYGPHFCLGAQLARRQMQALFRHFLASVESFELSGSPSYLRSNFQRGVKRLPLRFRPASCQNRA